MHALRELGLVRQLDNSQSRVNCRLLAHFQPLFPLLACCRHLACFQLLFHLFFLACCRHISSFQPLFKFWHVVNPFYVQKFLVVHSHPTPITLLSTWTNNVVKRIGFHYTLSIISYIIGPRRQGWDMSGMRVYNQAFLFYVWPKSALLSVFTTG
jgi:hypothetical protein